MARRDSGASYADIAWLESDALMVVVDAAETVAAANPAMCRAAGRSLAALIGSSPADLVEPAGVAQFLRAVRGAARTGLPHHQEHPFPTGDPADRLSIAWSIRALPSHPGSVACVGVDVTATRNDYDALRDRSVTDELTGLPNRAGLLERLALLADSGAAVIFCDLDGFKAVNDTGGHAAGDAVLVEVGRRLKRAARGEDFVARLGGDEFVILAPDAHSDLDAFTRRLIRAADQPMILPGSVVVTVGISFGIGVLKSGDDPAEVLHTADKNMYRMKSRLGTEATAPPPL